jgi:hypothetical protein
MRTTMTARALQNISGIEISKRKQKQFLFIPMSRLVRSFQIGKKGNKDKNVKVY